MSWFGGEPLLALDIIKYMSEKFINYCGENKIGYSSDIVTNGTLLTKETADILASIGVSSVHINLYGTKHSSIRMRKNFV